MRWREEHQQDNTRGMTGMGVIIFLITLILVAAIAAGLIIDTSGKLQNTAHVAGQESTAEISDRLNVLAVGGEVIPGDTADDPNQIDVITLTVYSAVGADNIDLQQVTIEYFSPYGSTFLLHEDEYASRATGETTFTADLGEFSVEAAKDDDDSIPVLNSRNDRASVRIDLAADSGPNTDLERLQPAESATVRITTQAGATTTAVVNVPVSLAGDDGGTVLL